jgi:hypothetical protein
MFTQWSDLMSSDHNSAMTKKLQLARVDLKLDDRCGQYILSIFMGSNPWLLKPTINIENLWLFSITLHSARILKPCIK